MPVGLRADAIEVSACAMAYAAPFSPATSTSIATVSGGAIAEATLTAVAEAASVAHDDDITTSLEASVALSTALAAIADAAKARTVSMKTSMAFLNRREKAGVQASEQLQDSASVHGI